MKKFTFIASVLITTFFLFPQVSKADTVIIIKDGTSQNSGVSNEAKKMLQVIKAPRYRNISLERNIIGEIEKICYEKLKTLEGTEWSSGCKTVFYPTESDLIPVNYPSLSYLNALRLIKDLPRNYRDVLLERDNDGYPKVCYERNSLFDITTYFEVCPDIIRWAIDNPQK